MAAAYLPPDVHGLARLAVLVDLFWQEPSVALAAEIRQQEALYGLNPISRRRLQWDVARPQEAPQRSAAPAPSADRDPRNVLRVLQ